jgi:zinc/manganese transport system permease protein
MLPLALFYRPLAVDSFDPVFLRMAGGHDMRGLFVTLVLLNLVVSFQAFGTLLAIGPMLLPAAAARCWTNRPSLLIVLASALGMLSCYAELLLSYHRNLPSGPAIVMAAGAIYLPGARSYCRSNQTSSIRQPLYWLLTIRVRPFTYGCQQVAARR